MTYKIEQLVETFKKHHERSAVLNKQLIEQFVMENPGKPIPDPFNDDFSLPLALACICEEIVELKGERNERI